MLVDYKEKKNKDNEKKNGYTRGIFKIMYKFKR